jgi:hypothetical protein
MTDASIRNQLFKALYDNRMPFRLADSFGRLCDVSAEFVLQWDILTILEEQFGREKGLLARMIVINGVVPDAQATTVQEYVVKKWPVLGNAVLEALQESVSQPSSHQHFIGDGGAYFKIEPRGSTSNIRVNESIAEVLEVGEILCYLVCACRSSGEDHLTYSAPDLTQSDSDDLTFRVEARTYPVLEMTNDADCWVRLFYNPVVAHGYPIAHRPSGERGLELDVHMMAVLGEALLATVFHSVTLLEGAISAFVPMAVTESSIVWHYLINHHRQRSNDGDSVGESHRYSHLSYDCAASQAAVKDAIKPSEFQLKRHFVGLWTKDALVPAETKDASYAIRPSISDVLPQTISIRSITFGGGYYATMSATFARGGKDTAPEFQGNVAVQQEIQPLRDMVVVLYDTIQKLAWLVNCQQAVVYCLRAWLESPSNHARRVEPKSNLVRALKELDDAFTTCPGDVESVLLHNPVRRVKMYWRGEGEAPERSDEALTKDDKPQEWWTVGDQIGLLKEKLPKIRDHFFALQNSAGQVSRKNVSYKAFANKDIGLVQT